MVENKKSATAATREHDPATRARDQLGALFFVLAIALAGGAVAAGRDLHGTFLSHAVWWWVGWSLLMYTPALIFAVVPWAMRTVFRMSPRSAVEDATRATYGLIGFAAALATLDALVTGSSSEFPPRDTGRLVFVFGLAPLGATLAALRVFRGRMAWLLVLLPLAIFLNALLVEWAAGFFGKSFTR